MHRHSTFPSMEPIESPTPPPSAKATSSSPNISASIIGLNELADTTSKPTGHTAVTGTEPTSSGPISSALTNDDSPAPINTQPINRPSVTDINPPTYQPSIYESSPPIDQPSAPTTTSPTGQPSTSRMNPPIITTEPTSKWISQTPTPTLRPTFPRHPSLPPSKISSSVPSSNPSEPMRPLLELSEVPSMATSPTAALSSPSPTTPYSAARPLSQESYPLNEQPTINTSVAGLLAAMPKPKQVTQHPTLSSSPNNQPNPSTLGTFPIQPLSDDMDNQEDQGDAVSREVIVACISLIPLILSLAGLLSQCYQSMMLHLCPADRIAYE
mmetsp:Transcript_25327/g.43247  ORF Transcript_25327/g.43247 Transcript_25327/m.43247 type:complete len:326 (-) Transcript_25327:107-1084(-)